MQTNRANRTFAIVLPLMLVAVSSVVLGSTGVGDYSLSPILLPTKVVESIDPEWLTTDRFAYLETENYAGKAPDLTLKRYHEGALLRADLTTYTVETPYKVKRVPDSSMEQGKTKTVVKGQLGLITKTIVETKIGLKMVSRVKLAERRIKSPVEEVVHYGTKPPLKKLVTKSGTYYYRKALTVTATAYEPSEVSCGDSADGLTSIGLIAGPGIIAVDPRVIPLRTKVYVEGYGYAIAGDVGGAIKGNRIDVCFNTVREALNFGRRKVTVYILEEVKK